MYVTLLESGTIVKQYAMLAWQMMWVRDTTGVITRGLHQTTLHLGVLNHLTQNIIVAVYSRTQTAAIPIPVPTHIDVTPTFLSVRFSSVNSVLTCLAPVHPSG